MGTVYSSSQDTGTSLVTNQATCHTLCESPFIMQQMSHGHRTDDAHLKPANLSVQRQLNGSRTILWPFCCDSVSDFVPTSNC